LVNVSAIILGTLLALFGLAIGVLALWAKQYQPAGVSR
jgi:hypothetical protein